MFPLHGLTEILRAIAFERRNTRGHHDMRIPMIAAIVLSSGWFGIAWAEIAPSDLRKLYALIIVDTLSGLGESVSVDGDRVFDLLRSGVPRDRLDVTVLTGKDVTANRIREYYRDVKCGSTDGLLFYYAGHGATDPEKGHFFALQKLKTAPLLRSDLRKAMEAHHPGLLIILTDCCSTRFKLGKKRKVVVTPGNANRLDPTLRCLFFQHRGVVDVTATSEGAAFGDDDEGGLFTRTLAHSIKKRSDVLNEAPGGFVSWAELFPEIQQGTAREFTHWARQQQARGEAVDQRTQKPRAFELPRDPSRPSLTLRNGSSQVIRYRYRWGSSGEWEPVVVPPEGSHLHVAPLGPIGGDPPNMIAVFENGESESLKVGKIYRFTPDQKKSRHIEDVEQEADAIGPDAK